MWMRWMGLFGMYVVCLPVAGQVTTGTLSGKISGEKGRALADAAVRLVDVSTGIAYFAASGKTGFFLIPDINPGTGFTLEVSALNYLPWKQTGISIALGESTWTTPILEADTIQLQRVTVHSRRGHSSTGVLRQEQLELLPGTQLYDHLRSIPYAKLQEGNEGAVSFAGQNNRYNSLYVDGAVNNDVFGLSASGTNGGQAAIPLLPMDAIAQYQVAPAPYDASFGNFTGATVNAVTRAGGNQGETAVYHYFSSRFLSGKPPAGAQKEARTPDRFFMRTYGFRKQGPLVAGKLFYFINTEMQRDLFSQPFAFESYKGNTKESRLIGILANTLRGTYQYDPGTWLDNPSTVNADRVATRFDWHLHAKHLLTVSARYTYAQRLFTNAGNPYTLHFSNDGYALFSGTFSVSAEWKTRLRAGVSNSLLLTYTSTKDDREPLNQPFPRVRINDGEGAILFGTDNSATINLLLQENINCVNKMKFTRGIHTVTLGLEMERNRVFNAFIQNSFGNYSYASLGDFLTNGKPSAYQVNFSLTDAENNDHTSASAQFAVVRTAVFANDEIHVGSVTVQLGMRLDKTLFPLQPSGNEYVNTVAFPRYGQYWDLQHAGSGKPISIPVDLSPRLGFVYRFSKQQLVLRGGLGVFVGRIPLAWPAGVYSNNGLAVGGFSATLAQLGRIRFRPDPYRQWMPAMFGVAPNKEPLNVIADPFRLPSLWRSSLAMDKKWKEWNLSLEMIYSKNIRELQYTNIGILPPTEHAEGPDSRSVYSSTNNARIPLDSAANNPFDYAILLGNRNHQTGYAYDVVATLTGPLGNNWKLDLNYHYGQSYVNHEGTASVNTTQWRSVETVNGRNRLERSVSDFSAGHRAFAVLSRRFPTGRKTAVTLSMVYTGQSGSPISYVYEGSMTRDDGALGSYDLIYVPTQQELEASVFLPNTLNGITYTPAAQKEALNRYIENDRYLRSRRGRYAERNGSRLPFTHIIDLRLRFEARTKIAGHFYRIRLTLDLFNATNFLNGEWGKRYYQLNDNIRLIQFAGYGGVNGLTPQYRFDPGRSLEPKYTISASSNPTYSAHWNARLGCTLLF